VKDLPSRLASKESYEALQRRHVELQEMTGSKKEPYRIGDSKVSFKVTEDGYQLVFDCDEFWMLRMASDILLERV
jgi:hypothetical protein